MYVSEHRWFGKEWPCPFIIFWNKQLTGWRLWLRCFFPSQSLWHVLSHESANEAEQDISNTKRIIIFIFLPRDNTFIFSWGPRNTASNCCQWFKVSALADLLKTSRANAAVTNVCVRVLWHLTLQVNVYKGQKRKHRLISFSLKDSLLFSHIVCVAVARVVRLMQR